MTLAIVDSARTCKLTEVALISSLSEAILVFAAAMFICLKERYVRTGKTPFGFGGTAGVVEYADEPNRDQYWFRFVGELGSPVKGSL